MQATDDFNLNEYTVSQTAARRGVPNKPGDKEIAAIRELHKNIIQPLSKAVGKHVVINSGFRSLRVNRLVGGAKSSQHTKGEAADIIIPGMSVEEVIFTIRKLNLPFDQLINEFGSWTHVSYGPRKRKEVLNARVTKKGVVYERLV